MMAMKNTDVSNIRTVNLETTCPFSVDWRCSFVWSTPFSKMANFSSRRWIFLFCSQHVQRFKVGSCNVSSCGVRTIIPANMIENAIAANNWDSMYGDKFILTQNDDSMVVILKPYGDYLASCYLNYRIAGKIGEKKFWRMSKTGCFGEYNFGISALAASPRITSSIHFGAPKFG